MKSRFLVLLAGVLAVILSGAPVAADSGMKMQPGDPSQKDMCLLVAMNCANETETLQQRIERLHNEIGKGTDVYTPDELNRLKRDLQDETKEMRDLTRPGGEGHHHSDHHR